MNKGPIMNPTGGFWTGADCPEKNTIARVVGLETDVLDNGYVTGELVLLFECGKSGLAFRFRKIKPDTEPCEEEFTVLIKRGRKVSA
jgi:hypothetical protein